MLNRAPHSDVHPGERRLAAENRGPCKLRGEVIHKESTPATALFGAFEHRGQAGGVLEPPCPHPFAGVAVPRPVERLAEEPEMCGKDTLPGGRADGARPRW